VLLTQGLNYVSWFITASKWASDESKTSSYLMQRDDFAINIILQ